MCVDGFPGETSAGEERKKKKRTIQSVLVSSIFQFEKEGQKQIIVNKVDTAGSCNFASLP